MLHLGALEDEHLPTMKARVCPMAVPSHTSAQPRGTPKMAPPAIAKSAPGNMIVTAATSAICTQIMKFHVETHMMGGVQLFQGSVVLTKARLKLERLLCSKGRVSKQPGCMLSDMSCTSVSYHMNVITAGELDGVSALNDCQRPSDRSEGGWAHHEQDPSLHRLCLYPRQHGLQCITILHMVLLAEQCVGSGSLHQSA